MNRTLSALVKIALFILLTTFAVSCSSDNSTSDNPLLSDFNTYRETPPFSAIRPEQFAPAVEAAITQAKANIAAIVNNPELPTFENTIEALEFSSLRLDTITSILFNLNQAETSPALQKVVREISPGLTAFGNDITLNPLLFQRIQAVYLKRDSLGLTTEQSTLLAKTYKKFIKSGANLDTAGKARFRAISQELSNLSLQFDENVLAETNGYSLHLTNEADLSGLPQTVKDAAAQTAKGKGMTGWVITLDYPSYSPFMRYADKRELREQLYKAYASRCSQGNSHDNRQTVLRITELRLELAQLLGYKNYAEMSLTDSMAETPARVLALQQQLLEPSMQYARKELAALETFARGIGATLPLQKWDRAYYEDKLKQQQYSYSEEDLKPYFQLEKVQDGIFTLANKLYGLSIVPNKEISVYHPDVKAYEVFDQDGRFLSVLYLDFFPREGKSDGAWMTNFRSQYRRNGVTVRPQVSIVTNFTRPTANAPALLSFIELTTFLHEFGHALHGMLSEGSYPSLTGTSVYQDFVELPSQIMENWAVERDFLNLFAAHYQTGEQIPQTLVQKVITSRNFMTGTTSAGQLGYGLLDMAWHLIENPVTGSIAEFEKTALSSTNLMPDVPGALVSVTFTHIFSGGYAAGYYGYKWAEVLDADAFSLFKQNGIFDKTTAQSFRSNILSKGGSEHPMALYKRFRGQEPTVDALLERSGMKM